MIVISGALVAVALLLLVVGLTVTTLNLIYASIAVSVVSLACLLLGIYQRRGELPVASGAQVPADVAPAAQALDPDLPDLPVVPAQADATLVLIVAGRPRYHTEGCRYLTGKPAEQVTVALAQSDGFTACVVCKPGSGPVDAPVAAVPAQPAADSTDVPFDLAASGPLHLDAPVPAEAAPVVPAARVPAARKPARSKVAPAPSVDQPVAAAPEADQPVPAQPVPAQLVPDQPVAALVVPGKVAAAVRTPARTPAKRAVVVPVLPVVLAPLAPAAVDLDRVVVIADRTKFHLSDCRFVRAAADTSLVTRQAAGEQGFVACGVCKP